MTRPSPRSCSTSSTPPSSEPGVDAPAAGGFSRRTLLVLPAVVASLGLVQADPASAAPQPAPPPRPGGTVVVVGTTKVEVTLRNTQDVLALRYTVTNMGTTAQTYMAYRTDTTTHKQSRHVTFSVNPGETYTADIFGNLNHQFILTVCPTGQACFTVGPVGPDQTTQAARAA